MMHILERFFPKPAHREVRRFVVPTKAELTEAQRELLRRQTSIRCQLAVYNATTTPEQRAADREAYWANARSAPVKMEEEA